MSLTWSSAEVSPTLGGLVPGLTGCSLYLIGYGVVQDYIAVVWFLTGCRLYLIGLQDSLGFGKPPFPFHQVLSSEY